MFVTSLSILWIRSVSPAWYLFVTYMHKRNNDTVTYFLKFMSIFFKSYTPYLMCFDIWARKTIVYS